MWRLAHWAFAGCVSVDSHRLFDSPNCLSWSPTEPPKYKRPRYTFWTRRYRRPSTAEKAVHTRWPLPLAWRRVHSSATTSTSLHASTHGLFNEQALGLSAIASERINIVSFTGFMPLPGTQNASIQFDPYTHLA